MWYVSQNYQSSISNCHRCDGNRRREWKPSTVSSRLATLLRFLRGHLRWSVMVCDASRCLKSQQIDPFHRSVWQGLMAGPYHMSNSRNDHVSVSNLVVQTHNCLSDWPVFHARGTCLTNKPNSTSLMSDIVKSTHSCEFDVIVPLSNQELSLDEHLNCFPMALIEHPPCVSWIVA